MAHTLLSTSPRGNATQRIDAAFEVTAFSEEGHHDICLASGLTFDVHPRRQHGNDAGRLTDERERRSLDDPYLLGGVPLYPAISR